MNALCSIHAGVALVMPASVDQEELFTCMGEHSAWRAELPGLRHAVPNLPGSSVNPKCLEKRSSEHAEGLGEQLCQADGWLWGTVHTRVLP